MRSHPTNIAVIVVLGLIPALCGVVSAGTHLDVDAGWGFMARSDRWTPVFVTASDPKTRNVELDIEWPVGGSYSMHIRQAMTIDATPRTFLLLTPVHGWTYQQAKFAMIDQDTGKTLAHFPKDPDSGAQLFGSGYSDPAAAFVGVSGTQTQLASFQSATGNHNIGFLPTPRLPAVSLGYDALDVLILNEPNLAHANSGPPALEVEQQQAIVDWVRAGGKLILWPGDAGFPASGPLADVLPAKVDEAETIELSPEDLAAIGLPSRFKSLISHRLEARAGAQRLPMLDAGQIAGYAARVGLGRIVLSPVNLGELQLDDTAHCRTLWRSLLENMVAMAGEHRTAADARPVAAAPNAGNGYISGESQDANASMRIADFLGDGREAEQTAFSHIAYALIGLMFIVGPVDWFVLKKLGRRPWTWVTTSGWIGLVTTGAILAGYSLKAGDVQYKTLRVIDQVGDSTIAGTDYVSLYSSRGRVYRIKTDRDGWWQPGALSERGTLGLRLDIDFHQTREGNTPQEVLTNVRSERFLRGDHMGAGPPMISADLHRVMVDEHASPLIVGTITNLTDRPLKNVRVEVREGYAVCEMSERSASSTTPATRVICTGILPHATVRIEATPTPGEVLQERVDAPDGGSRYYPRSNPLVEADLWKAAADLNHRRGKQMAEQVAMGNSAIVYAETDDPAPVAELLDHKAIEKHYEFIRALVDLWEGAGK